MNNKILIKEDYNNLSNQLLTNQVNIAKSEIDQFFDSIDIENNKILYRIGLTHICTGLTGSAAGFDLDNTKNRAFYELIERTLIYQNKDLISKDHGTNSTLFKYSLSNGIAIHTNYETSKNNALYELIERHLILANWFGLNGLKPSYEPNFFIEPITLSGSIFRFKCFNLGNQLIYWKNNSSEIHKIYVSAVIAERDNEHILIAGFGAGSSLSESLRKSYQECLQRLAFLFDELDDGVSDISNLPYNSPEYHQEHFLAPEGTEQLMNWLENGNAPQESLIDLNMPAEIQIIELNANPYLIQAKSESTIPLIFGTGYQTELSKLIKFNEKALFIHPIV